MTEYPLIVGGHSKGGNFAVYASAFCKCSVQDRIVRVYSMMVLVFTRNHITGALPSNYRTRDQYHPGDHRLLVCY